MGIHVLFGISKSWGFDLHGLGPAAGGPAPGGFGTPVTPGEVSTKTG